MILETEKYISKIFKEFHFHSRTEAFLSVRIESKWFENDSSTKLSDYIPAEYHILRNMFFAGKSPEKLYSFLQYNLLDSKEDQYPGFLDCRHSGQEDSYILLHLVKDATLITYNLYKDRKAVLIRGKEGDFLYVSNLWSRKKLSDPVMNEKQVFGEIASSLKYFKMDFRSVYRTWFFLDNILSWYSEFNQTRTLFYESKSIFPGEYPASTGIGIRNSFKIPVYAFVNAVNNFKGTIRPVQSGEQCSATDYGSSFSRGMVLVNDHYKRLFLSGTASIDNSGKSVFRNDIKSQVQQTLKVIDALMKEENMKWKNVVSAIFYIKNHGDYDLMIDAIKNEVSLDFPYVVCGSVICREELLFEMEIEFFKTH